MIGIQYIECYYPRQKVSMPELETYDSVSQGKYTIGLGQQSCHYPHPDQEDVPSMMMTCIRRMMDRWGLVWKDIGRLEVGNESNTDTSKSYKTVLCQMIPQQYRDIEGADHKNACYGGTNALFAALSWVDSSFWDGRHALVLCGDIAAYKDKPARPTGGSGVVAMLVTRTDYPLVTFEPWRSSDNQHIYDFYKPGGSETPVIDGKTSVTAYINSVTTCFNRLKEKTASPLRLADFPVACFHAPFGKMVVKAHRALCELEGLDAGSLFEKQVKPSLDWATTVGNTYTGALYFCLANACGQFRSQETRALLFSYGSGCISTMFVGKIQPFRDGFCRGFKECAREAVTCTPETYHNILDKVPTVAPEMASRTYRKVLGEMQMYEYVVHPSPVRIWVDESQCCHVELNRPTKANALTSAMLTQLCAFFDENPMESFRAIFISGSGKHFCAGMDLSDAGEGFPEKYADFLHRLKTAPVLVVARTKGAVVGGGLGLVAVADHVSADPGTFFQFSEIHHKLLPYIVSHFLGEHRSSSHSCLRWVTNGHRFGTDEAKRVGLVTEIGDYSLRQWDKADIGLISKAYRMLSTPRGLDELKTELSDFLQRKKSRYKMDSLRIV
jgi:hydroxymethylglutaryl-CoA synthase